jgi:hypothetical protein
MVVEAKDFLMLVVHSCGFGLILFDVLSGWAAWLFSDNHRKL